MTLGRTRQDVESKGRVHGPLSACSSKQTPCKSYPGLPASDAHASNCESQARPPCPLDDVQEESDSGDQNPPTPYIQFRMLSALRLPHV